ncbi:MAG: ribosome biogenesis GTPase Der [Planctomycetes bacterium]|jgi:GTP-binding protein|nr:ribosome biogenesis GTPase Der [Planctomycetota bacterium]
MIPVVAIIGRPNTGKSTLFNVLVGKKISIVDEIAGVTRDRVTALVTWNERVFELMDTGGIGMVDVADIAEHVEKQIETALHVADVVVFLTDVRDGVLPLDRRVAGELRKLGRPVILAANKAETVALEAAALDFHALGFGEPIAISAQNRINTTVLLDAIVSGLPVRTVPEETESGPRVAIIGRRNSGKSTFLNAVVGQERVIVSEQPGTTRDSVDVRVRVEDRVLTLIDTAGVQRRSSAAGSLDYLAQHRTERSMRRAQAVLLLIDATEEVGELDKKAADYSLEHGKPTVLVVNKWDLAGDRATTSQYERYLRERLPMLNFSPIVFASAKTGEQVLSCLRLVDDLLRQSRERVGTGELNRVLREALETRSPRTKSKVAKLFYASQVGVEPPAFVLFVNDPDLFDPAYRRFLESRLRHAFPFPEVPIHLRLRGRKGD